MSTTTEKPVETPYRAVDVVDPNLQYRTLNRAAIASVVLFFLGLTGLLFSQLLILPLAGIMLGISAIRTIRRYPDEYSGLTQARLGVAACLLLLVGGVAYHSFTYVTEVPKGHTRVSFSELQPDSMDSRSPLPKRAIELRGQKIFIKGYMHPGVSGRGKVSQFILVPDFGTCCFGGQPKMTDMIMVNTAPDAKQSYGMSAHQISLTGEFNLGDRLENFGEIKNVLYRLEAYKPPVD